MDINAIWQTIEPYVMTVVGALAGGTGIYALVRSFVGKWINKFGAKYDTERMADKVADKLIGKTIDVDVTAVTEKKLDKIAKALNKQIAEIQAASESYKRLLVLIASAVSKFKAVTDDERKEFEAAIKEIDDKYKAPEKEVIATVKLAPIEPEGTTEETQEESLINFGGIDK